jgi:Kef-type K+ transport system membrane component KefB/nucleotide-binding universal stress UspA family protein
LTGPFTAAPHHDVLLLLVQISVLLACARLFGELALRLGQPSVVGEISAGIILGPSCLSAIFPKLGEHLVPHTPIQGHILEVVSMIGAMFLLLITGLETDAKLIKRHARTAAGVSFGGIVTTFATGFALGMYLPDKLLAKPDQRIVFALFVATAMSISAIPVIAKVLMDMNLMRRDIGQTILAAGMSDDTSGWILLSIVAALASGQEIGGVQVAIAVGKVLFFLLISFTVGRWVIQKAVEFTQDEIKSRDRLITLVVVFAFAFGAFAQALGLEAVLGAFVCGILLSGMRRIPAKVPHLLETMALGIFAPIFFGVAGLKVDIKGLLDPELAWFALLVILVACGGKVVGTYIGARLIGKKDHWTALSFGAGLNARGAMEIIIATIGLSLGILTQAMFSIIVLMAMVTSLMAPTALRFCLARVVPSDEEMARLQKEERAAKSALAGLHRVLVPVRMRTDGPGPSQQIESAIVRTLTRKGDLSVTLMTIVPVGERAAGQTYLDRLGELFSTPGLIKKVVEGVEPIPAILDESKKDYQMLMIGATEAAQQSNSDSLFSPAIDELIELANCSTLIFKAGDNVPSGEYEQILVPTNGSEDSLRAAELAFRLAAGKDCMVKFLHVIVRDAEGSLISDRTEQLEYALGRGQQIVAEMVTFGESLGVRCSGEVRIKESVAAGILVMITRHQVDLLLLGTNVRPGGERLFLGTEVERVLKSAPCPVIVVNA